jgi:uncharacterized repeat protein (TIGR03803 family)
MKLRQILTMLVMALACSAMSRAQNVKFKVLHNFGSPNDGNVPSGPLLTDAHGNLYGGTTAGPGQGAYGIIFELMPQANGTWREQILYKFSGETGGGFPWGGLVVDAHGNLYGTLEGSTNTDGAVFELEHRAGTWASSVLYTDGIAKADGPGVVFDKLGNLYGDIGPGQDYAGAIGQLSPGPTGWTYAQLYSYCPQNDCSQGVGQTAAPIWDASGNLWGDTVEGGISQSPCFTSSGCGVIFEMTPDEEGSWTYNVMHQFASTTTDGQGPYGGLILDSAGNFYGSTLAGGTHSYGTIFKFSNVGGTWQETILYNFSNCTLACYPEGTLAIDASGNLYGTAQGGRNSCAGYGCGVIFKLAPQSNGTWKYSTLYNLNETSGGVSPFYGVILDSKGNLYGVTSNFGKYNLGTAFELTP